MPSVVAIIGAGPRGLAVAGRLLVPSRRADVEVVLIDTEPGGEVWRTDLDPELLMNSRGDQAMLFADETLEGAELDEDALDFSEWSGRRDVRESLPSDVRALAEQLTPESFVPRRLFGHYTRWVLAEWERRGARVVRDRAVDLERREGRMIVTLERGDTVESDAVVVATGHAVRAFSQTEADLESFAATHGLVYIPAGTPSAHSLRDVRPREPVLLRGVGLAFYDVIALLSAGRGGVFVDSGARLDYVPSGDEPVMHVTSGRGVPYRARSDERPTYRLPGDVREAFAALRDRGEGTSGVDFDGEVWPVIARELERVHEEAGGAPLDWDDMLDPLGRVGETTQDELTAAMLAILRSDIRSAQVGGAATRVAEAFAVLKDQVRELVAFGVFSWESIRHLQGWFRSVGAYVAAGPPLIRVRQAEALMRAGLLVPLGADASLRCDDDDPAFEVRTRERPEAARFGALVEARLPAEDTRTTRDRLTRALIDRGYARSATARDADGGRHDIGGLEVVRSTREHVAAQDACRVIDSRGVAADDLFVIGLPVQPQEWNIANLPQPRRADRTFVQAEAIAAQIMGRTRAPQDAANAFAQQDAGHTVTQ